MMYFIPWVVFLVAVVLAVPIASFLEKRKLQAALGPQPEPIGEEEMTADEEFGEAEPAAEAAELEGAEAEEVAEIEEP